MQVGVRKLDRGCASPRRHRKGCRNPIQAMIELWPVVGLKSSHSVVLNQWTKIKMVDVGSSSCCICCTVATTRTSNLQLFSYSSCIEGNVDAMSHALPKVERRLVETMPTLMRKAPPTHYLTSHLPLVDEVYCLITQGRKVSVKWRRIIYHFQQ